MKQQINIALRYTLITAVLLGLAYPALVTVIAHVAFPRQAAGSLITSNGTVIGSSLIGQPFTGPTYFHSRPSAAGAGYDAANSSGSNLAPTSKALIDRITASTASEASTTPVPIDLVTTSASGLDPDITPAAALYQVPRIAHQRNLPEATVRQLVTNQIKPRQLGLLGEPTVNVLTLNLKLDQTK